MLILTRHDIKQAVTMTEAVNAVADAFVALSAGRAIAPVRLGMADPDNGGLLLLMPGLVRRTAADGDQEAAKLVSVNSHNPARGLPLIHAVVVLFEAASSRPIALLEGTYLTAMRTGAASGAATRVLARPDAARVGLFGAGAQAMFQLEAVCGVRPVTHVKVYSRTLERTRAFCSQAETRLRETTGRAITVAVATSAREAADADIIITATTSRTPVLPDDAIRAGTHINAVGAYTHEMHELEGETVARARVIVDARAGAMAEAGDILIPMHAGLFGADHISAELGEVIGSTLPGRTSPDDITLFKSVGNAVQDVAVAALAVQRARHMGLGTEVDLSA